MYSLEDKYVHIKNILVKSKSKNPIKLINEIMNLDFINMHGPEHHFLDGACFLVAYANCVEEFDINIALDKLAERTIKMPGAMCGYWGVCGSVTSLGAALSIINNTSPISDTEYYKDNMKFSSSTISIMSKIGGPRCCKRNAYISLSNAIEFVKNEYNVGIETENIECSFSLKNKQCIKVKCPYYKNGK